MIPFFHNDNQVLHKITDIAQPEKNALTLYECSFFSLRSNRNTVQNCIALRSIVSFATELPEDTILRSILVKVIKKNSINDFNYNKTAAKCK